VRGLLEPPPALDRCDQRIQVGRRQHRVDVSIAAAEKEENRYLERSDRALKIQVEQLVVHRVKRLTIGADEPWQLPWGEVPTDESTEDRQGLVWW
jgi:ribonucleotide reductase alpha subunit